MEPPSGLAAAGWAGGQKPPAPYFNFLLSLAGQWTEFLRGPNVGQWTRHAWATSPATFDAPTALAFGVDTVTSDGTDACYRFAVVGEETGPTTALRVSQTGETWTRRTNVPSGMSAPFVLHTDGVRWMLGGTTGGGYELHTTPVDDGTGTGAIGSGSGSWSGASFPSSPSEPKALASHGGRTFLLTASEGFYSDDSGENWSAYSVSGTARSADGRSVVFDGSKWVFITQSGQVYASTDGASFTYKSTLSISASWRLAAGEDGEVVAYRLGGSTSQNLYRSLNSGTTWTAETPTGDSLPTYLTELRYQDGTWLATSSAAPWLWTSTDLVSWLALRTPAVPSSSSDLFALVFEGGRWTVLGNGYALTCGRAADPAPGDYVPGSLPAYLSDAGYLRGLAVSSDAPSDGDVLTWDATAEEWVPAAPTGGGVDAESIRGTPVDTVFSPTTGQVLTWSGSKWQPATPVTLADVLALLLAGPGLQVALPPTSVTGTGGAASVALTMPSGLTLTNGRKYLVEGTVIARKSDGTLLYAAKVEGVLLERSAGAWGLVTPGDVRLLGDAHADIASYFSAEDRRPAVGFDGASLTVDWTATNSVSWIVEADLSIADRGVSTV